MSEDEPRILQMNARGPFLYGEKAPGVALNA
jgi:hypothetical protein